MAHVPRRTELDDRARSLARPEEAATRRSLLYRPYMRPLTDWVQDLRHRFPDYTFPDFDPLGGGVSADLLFLAEKPGPKAAGALGSGFISTCNDDPTAEASWKFLRTAGIPTSRIVFWNIIPWWDGTIAYSSADVRKGLELLGELIPKLPRLTVAVLIGSRSAVAEDMLTASGVKVFRSAHPGMRVKNAFRDRWDAIPHKWASAREEADAVSRADRHQRTKLVRPLIEALKDIASLEISSKLSKEHKVAATAASNMNAALAVELSIKTIYMSFCESGPKNTHSLVELWNAFPDEWKNDVRKAWLSDPRSQQLVSRYALIESAEPPENPRAIPSSIGSIDDVFTYADKYFTEQRYFYEKVDTKDWYIVIDLRDHLILCVDIILDFHRHLVEISLASRSQG